MKKLFVALFAVCLLASCGKSKEVETTNTWVTTGTSSNETVVSGNSCDSYVAYLECTYKKSNLDEATIKTTLDQTKSAWAQLPSDQSEAFCKEAINATKQAPLVEGCSL